MGRASSHKCELIKNVVEIIWLAFLSVLKVNASKIFGKDLILFYSQSS